MSEGSVKAGRRVKLALEDFEGEAGLQDDVLAYVPNRHGSPLLAGAQIHIEGKGRTVIGVERSAYVQRMVLATLAPESE